jgi:hypothetical protein
MRKKPSDAIPLETFTPIRPPAPTSVGLDSLALIVPIELEPLGKHPCPECHARVTRYATGTMAYHGATKARGVRCPHPDREKPMLATLEGLVRALSLWPACGPVYAAVAARLRWNARIVPRAHGGQLKHPDRRDPGWRWRRKP